LFYADGGTDYFFDMINHMVILNGPCCQPMVHKLICFTMAAKIIQFSHHFEFLFPGQ